MLVNAASLAATTLITAGLGVAFWAVTTRVLDQGDVGRASALVSAFTLVATIAMLGYGSLLISELPRRSDTGSLIATVILAVGVLGTVLGVAWAVGLQRTADLAATVSAPAGFLLFTVGCAATTVTLVLDQATIGLLSGGLQMWRNLFHSVAKIALLAPFLVLGTTRADAPLWAWTVSGVLSIPLMTHLARRAGLDLWGPLRPKVLTELGRETWDHSLLTLAMVGSRMALPVVIAVAVSAEANAAFYVAYTISLMLAMIPNHLATVLFAVGRGDVEALREKLVFTLGLSYAIGIPASALVALLARPLLGIFGPAYAEQGVVPLLLLTATFPFAVVRLHYAAVQRVRGQLTRAWRLLLVCSIAEIGSVAWFGYHEGLDAAMVAFAVVSVVEGLVTLPTVWRAARERAGA